MLPEHINVERSVGTDWFELADEFGMVYGAGTAEQVHSWLGQHGYYKTGEGTGLTGWYKRARVSSVAGGEAQK